MEDKCAEPRAMGCTLLSELNKGSVNSVVCEKLASLPGAGGY